MLLLLFETRKFEDGEIHLRGCEHIGASDYSFLAKLHSVSLPSYSALGCADRWLLITPTGIGVSCNFLMDEISERFSVLKPALFCNLTLPAPNSLEVALPPWMSPACSVVPWLPLGPIVFPSPRWSQTEDSGYNLPFAILTNGGFTELFISHFFGYVGPHKHANFYFQFLSNVVRYELQAFRTLINPLNKRR